MKLYDYFRSTACYRVRIALNIKNIAYEKLEIHLVQDGGQQHRETYRALNPQGLVPSLEDNGYLLTQSLAIIDYLEDIVPNPPLLPVDHVARAQIRALALTVACDIHPLNNLRVLQYLRQHFDANETMVNAWYHQWLSDGFNAIEQQLQRLPREKPVCYGAEITLADICLIPQVYNAQRYQLNLESYPLIQAINAHCLSLIPFKEAAPAI